MCLESSFQTAPNWPQMGKMTPQYADMTSAKFWRFLVYLVNFSSSSNFHVNIITSSGVMTIFFYKELTRNPEIGNSLVWVLPNIWRLEGVGDTKFGTNVSITMFPNPKVTAFTVSGLLWENQQELPPQDYG